MNFLKRHWKAMAALAVIALAVVFSPEVIFTAVLNLVMAPLVPLFNSLSTTTAINLMYAAGAATMVFVSASLLEGTVNLFRSAGKMLFSSKAASKSSSNSTEPLVLPPGSDLAFANGYGVYARPRANTQPMSKQGLRFFDTTATGSSDNSLVEAERITTTPSTRH